MAASNPLNPINPNNAQTLLGKFAASDAKHDFETSFINIFKVKKYLNIGTTGTAPTEYFNEWYTFYNVFRNSLDDQRNPNYIFKGKGTDPGVNFKQKVLNTEADSIFINDGLSGISLNTDLAAAHTYTLRSKLFSTGNTVNLEDSHALLTFLGGENTDIYIQQDASFISFSDFFISAKNKDRVGPEKKNFYYLGSREGQNDAAGKTNSDSAVVTKTQDKKVSVSILEDNSNESIIYPKYDTDQNSDVKQNFQSIYNLSISPINTVKGVKMVSLNFYDKETINATQKGKAENAKANLKERLTNFLKNFNTSQNKDSYFTALQQKRSGDWLQVLSTYDLARYNISGRRGILITHDLICAAYAIAMGVDVVITIQYNGQKWLVFFQNDIYLTQPKKSDLHTRYSSIKTHIDTARILIVTEIPLYHEQRSRIIPSFITAINEVLPAVFTSGEATKTIQDKANIYIKELLKAYFRHTIVLNSFPDASIFQSKYNLLIKEKERLEEILDTWSTDGAPVDPLNRSIFSEYEKVVSDIYNIKETFSAFKIDGRDGPIINLTKIADLQFSTKSKSNDITQLNTFLESFSPFSVEDPTKADTSTTFLNRFRILKNNTTNIKKKNDYGVFAIYLNKLDDSKKNEIYTKILACKTSFITAVAGDTEERRKEKKQELAKNFQLFIDEINLYFKDAAAPSFEAGTTGELLSEINDIQGADPKPAEAEFIVTGGSGKGNTTATSATAGRAAGRAAAAEARAAAEAARLETERVAAEALAAAAEAARLETERVAAEAPAVAQVPLDTSSIVSSTPFSNYLIWLLTKRNEYTFIQKLYLKSIVAGLRTISVAGRWGIGTFFLKAAISSLIIPYLPPYWSNIVENIIFSTASNVVLGAGAVGEELLSVINPLLSNIITLSEITPYNLTTDAYLTLSNDLFIQEMSSMEKTLKTLEQLRRRDLFAIAATARGLGGGGPLDSFDLPYSNWATLFYHMDTMRTQLDDINNPEHGFDYSYFARYSQFLIAMEKSIDSTIRFFTIKSPKKGGKYGSTTVVLTDEPKVKSKPTQLVLRLKGGPLDLYEVPIGYSALFTSFGDYSDLILSNLLPRVYFDSIWDELKPMLTKAFTGSEDANAKWIGLVAETCNDNYLNTSADTNLNELLNPKDLFLRYFLITTCYNLEQMPILDMSIGGKESLERELNESIKRLVAKINLVEKNIIVHMYKKKVNDDSINFETINDLGFLMEKNLLLKPSEPEPESKPTEGGRRKKQLKKRSYGKTKKNGRKMRLKSRRKS